MRWRGSGSSRPGCSCRDRRPSATLGEWGADVIKVELPGFGDQARWVPVQRGDSRSAYFTACNRGKRSITVDLRRPEGREVFLRLAEWADVVITNFKPGTMDAWGLGYDDIAARNDRVVYAAGSTFGLAGPDAGREGADLSAQAVGGLISTTGRAAVSRRRRGHDRRPHRRPEPRRWHPRRAAGPGAHRARSAGRHVIARRADLGPGERDHGLPDDRVPGGPADRSNPYVPASTASSRPRTGGWRSSAWSARHGPASSR